MGEDIIVAIVTGVTCAAVGGLITTLVQYRIEAKKSELRAREIHSASWAAVRKQSKSLIYRVANAVGGLEETACAESIERLRQLYGQLEDFLYDYCEDLQQHERFSLLHRVKNNLREIIDVFDNRGLAFSTKMELCAAELAAIARAKGLVFEGEAGADESR